MQYNGCAVCLWYLYTREACWRPWTCILVDLRALIRWRAVVEEEHYLDSRFNKAAENGLAAHRTVMVSNLTRTLWRGVRNELKANTEQKTVFHLARRHRSEVSWKFTVWNALLISQIMMKPYQVQKAWSMPYHWNNNNHFVLSSPAALRQQLTLHIAVWDMCSITKQDSAAQPQGHCQGQADVWPSHCR